MLLACFVVQLFDFHTFFSFLCFLNDSFPIAYFSRVCLQVCIIRKFHFLARVGFFTFVLQYHFQNVFLLFRKLSPSTNGGCRSRSPKKCARRMPLTFCVRLPITFYALFISLWIRAQPFPFVYTRTKFDYLKIPNSAASATRAGRPFCFSYYWFLCDNWFVKTNYKKKSLPSVDTLLNFIKSRCTTLITSFRFLIHLLWLWNLRDFLLSPFVFLLRFYFYT